MKIRTEQDLSCEDIEITIKYSQKDKRLTRIIEYLQSYDGFVQISKSCLLNINVMKNIRPLLNSRMEATLNNGEKVYVSRKYLDEVKKALRNEEMP